MNRHCLGRCEGWPGRSDLSFSLLSIQNNDNMASGIPKVLNECEYFSGIGITCEASEKNPALYDFLFESVWQENAESKARPINIEKNNTFVPNGCAVDLAGEGKRYDDYIEEPGGIDLQLLGIGLDGHIGFNEPDKYFVKSTHVVDLHESTIKANSRFFENEDEVPKRAITMGMVSIMQAKKILLIANGKAKRDILEKAFYGPITPEIPASILQLHPDITVIYSEN